jgi:glycosyltransferase involved in cell wall biosynthesis
MHAKELVSIIIPTLNEEGNIERLLRSILVQDYRPIEVIIVDGGSRDNTLEIIRKFAEKYGNEEFVVRVLAEYGECRSPANAKNIGFANARGDYVLFIDADYVILDRNFISRVVEALRNTPWVSVRLIPVMGENNLLSFAQIVENRAWTPKGHVDERRCFRRDFLVTYANPPFNPCLGVGEDADLISKLRGMGFVPMFVDVRLRDVVPKSLRRFVRRFEWYGRTALRFYMQVRGYSRIRAFIQALRDNVGVWITIMYPLLLVLLYFLLNILGIFIVLILYGALRFRFFLKMPIKSLKVLVVISFLDFVRAMAYLYGLFKGLIGAKVRVSRDFV